MQDYIKEMFMGTRDTMKFYRELAKDLIDKADKMEAHMLQMAVHIAEIERDAKKTETA